MKPKRTILCVDDNEQALSVRKLILETRGYRVIACTDAEQAMTAFGDSDIDLVLSDLIMPHMDGAELIRRIKEVSPQTPAILFSGKISAYERDSQADVFLPKGTFAPAELLEKIRLLLVRRRSLRRSVVPPAPPAVQEIAS